MLDGVKMHGLLICTYRNSWQKGLVFYLFTLTKSRQFAAADLFSVGCYIRGYKTLLIINFYGRS